MSIGLSIDNTGLNCSSQTGITGISFSGAQPANTDRRLVFKIGGLAVIGSRTFPITTNAVAGDTVTIAGVTLTAVASGATGNQFNVGTTIALTATNIATALNAITTVSTIYSASANSNGIVTLSEKIAGGNTPTAATKTGTVVFGTGTVTTSVPTWYKLTITGGVASLTAVATQSITAASVLSEGNTVTELSTATSIPPFAGKTVYTAIALSATSSTTEQPTIGLEITGIRNQDQYTKTEYSQEYDVSGYEIYNTNLSTTAANGGSIVVEASTLTSGVWSDYMTLSALKGKAADKVKFRITYTSTTLGTSTAELNYLYLHARTTSSITLGNNADLISKTQEFGTGMMYSRLLIKHNRLKDAGIKAYISFGDKTLSRENLQIATGTGSPQTVTLADTNVDFSTITLLSNRTMITSFDFNTTSNSITFTAESGSTVFANYEYGFTPEAWQEMQKGTTQPYAGKDYDSTDYTYSIAGAEKGVSAIRMVMEKPDGSSTDEYLGTGTGRTQLFVLEHWAKEDTITLKQGTQPIASTNWSYDPVNRIITVIALKDTIVSATYQWTAETPKILGYVVAWNQ